MRAARKRALGKLVGAIFPAFFSLYFMAAICGAGGWPVFAIACAWSVAAYFNEWAAGAAWSGPLVGAVVAIVLLLGIWPFENDVLLLALRRWVP